MHYAVPWRRQKFVEDSNQASLLPLNSLCYSTRVSAKLKSGPQQVPDNHHQLLNPESCAESPQSPGTSGVRRQTPHLRPGKRGPAQIYRQRQAAAREA